MPAARVGADYKHLFSEIAYFQQTVEYLPNLSDTEVYFVNTESSLVAPLTTSLGIKVGYVVRFNSAPPVRAETSASGCSPRRLPCWRRSWRHCAIASWIWPGSTRA